MAVPLSRPHRFHVAVLEIRFLNVIIDRFMTHYVRHYNVPCTVYSIINLRHHALLLQDSVFWHMKWFETIKSKIIGKKKFCKTSLGS